jgi:hypothetical protein
MAYEAQGVTFDGTNDFIDHGTLTGIADSKLFSGALWVRFNVATGPDIIGRSEGNNWIVIYDADETIAIRGENAAGTKILDIATSAILDTDWHHVMWSVDLADTGKRHLYVDDASDLTVNTYTDDTIDFTQAGHMIGRNAVGGNLLNGDLGDPWLAPDQYIDLSIEANRRKFIGPNGGAVDLGSDGSTPTGTAPIMFFSGATVDWHTNKGTGGGFTETGALTDAATNPPTEPDAGNPAYYYTNMQAGMQ